MKVVDVHKTSKGQRILSEEHADELMAEETTNGRVAASRDPKIYSLEIPY